MELPPPAAAAARRGPRPPRAPGLLRIGAGLWRAAGAGGAGPGVTLLPLAGPRREDLPERRLSGRTLARALDGLEAARERFGLGRSALLVQSPFWAPLASAVKERFGWRVLYDCLDAHEGFATNRPAVLAAAERELAQEADLVLATSETLRRRMEGWNASCRLLPNACDFELFAPVAPPPAEGPLTVGYVGAVDEWFDGELLGRLAALSPDWRFEIVGGREGLSAPAGPRAPTS